MKIENADRSPVVKDDKLVDIYANNFNLDWTLFDVRIRFAQLMYIGEPSKGELVIEERAGVTLAWAEAKALSEALTNLVSKYEKLNGPITPPKLVAP